MIPFRLYLFILVGIAVLGLAYLLFRRKPKTADDLERERRAWLDRIGRITDGTVIDVQEMPGTRERPSTFLIYQYDVAGVSYEASQDVTYLRQFIEQYDGAIFSLPEYGQDLRVGQQFVTPAIDPFSAKNRELSDREIREFLGNYKIPTDRPLVTQISRFDRWKDPMGVIDAFRKAREQIDCTLVLLGNNASDDPEGGVILEQIKDAADDGIIILAADDPTLVNALQRSAAVVLQKSTREGFGLTVTEAMWKGAAVIGGDVGGIRHQIKDEWNGYLVNTPEQAAARMVQLLKDPKLRKQVGSRAKESVRQNFLMSRLLEDWLDLLGKYERPVI